MNTVQLGVLVQDTGERPRTLQHWSDVGILRAEKSTDKQGRGNVRNYRAEPLHGERAWALLASAFAKLRLPLGEIRDLIEFHRRLHDPIELLDKNFPEFESILRIRTERKNRPAIAILDPFEAAISGEPNVFAIVASLPSDSGARFTIVYLRQGDEASNTNNLLLRIMAHNQSAVMLNLSKIFEPLRRERVLPDQEPAQQVDADQDDQKLECVAQSAVA